MEKTNSVFLDGAVVGCRILRKEDGLVVAGLSFVTLYPRPGADREAKPSEKYDLRQHMVRVTGDGPDVGGILELEKDCRETTRLRPYTVSGTVVEHEGQTFIDCKAKDLKASRTIRVSGNNRTTLVGSIDAISYTDSYATVVVDTGKGRISTFFPKSTFRNAWEAVSEGKLGKGMLLSMEGPLLSDRFSDGRKEIRRSVVIPHTMEQIKLTKDKRKGGPSIG